LGLDSSAPIGPIHDFRGNDLDDRTGIEILKQANEVQTRVACIRHDQSIKSKELSGRSDSLRRGIVVLFIPCRIHAERFESLQVRKAGGAPGVDCQLVQLVSEPARPDGFQCEAVPDFSKCAVAFQTGVKHLEFAWRAPASTRGGSSRRVPAAACDAPYSAVEGLRAYRFKDVENIPIVNAPAPIAHLRCRTPGPGSR